jgi:hypothetical protein
MPYRVKLGSNGQKLPSNSAFRAPLSIGKEEPVYMRHGDAIVYRGEGRPSIEMKPIDLPRKRKQQLQSASTHTPETK